MEEQEELSIGQERAEKEREWRDKQLELAR